MIKKIFGWFSVVCFALMVTACSDETTTPTSTNQNSNFSNKNMMSRQEVTTFFTSPDQFKGRSIVLYGQVFNILDGQFQIHGDPDEVTNDVIIQGNIVSLKNDDIVKVSGVVIGKQDYQNVMGATMSSPMIEAVKVEKSDYITAFQPATRVIQVGVEKNQYGNKVKVDKVEFAEKQTRVYVTVRNDSKHKFSFYSNNTKLIQNGKQYEEQLGSNPDVYKTISSEIIPGSSTDGVIVYPATDPDLPLQIYMEGFSDNYDIQLKPFVVDVKK